ncbi:sulfurtransferase [Pelagibaculum spongiae]|uniref:Rhodanese domain-containing protein n=1 Tax=Pelagibaculum spongiae TaxID=2080658 RepID=A0A2V1GXM2_9GAMM|nr:rhodanese-like domain-containing protein [Pelagibaculum spongiae]PVZ71844.1 hypothetical protein DC094_02120 [Pelagibaculum spongiae]
MKFKFSRSFGALAASLMLAGCFATAEKAPASDQLTKIQPSQALSGDYLLVDSRSPDAFNGWTKNKDAASGHLPSAELLSARWINWQLDLDAAIARLEVKKDQKIAVYGETDLQRETVAKRLIAEKNISAEQVFEVTGEFSQWGKNFELQKLQGFQTLVPASYIESRIGKAVIVQIGWDGGKGKDYRKSHIPGAIYWDDIEFEMPPIWEARPVEVIRTALEKIGIDKNSEVIVYSSDPMGSTRGGAIMQYAGVENVKVLNGTFDTWKKLEMPLEKGWNQPQSIENFGVTGEGDSTVIINIEQAKQLRKQPNSALVSVRSLPEFYGEISGYGYFDKKGRIPGALNAPSGPKGSWDMSNYRNPDQTMRWQASLQNFLDQNNISKEMNISYYCGSGWRAAEVWWYTRAMGFENASIYSSGWMRWSSEASNPISKGTINKPQILDKQQALSK